MQKISNRSWLTTRQPATNLFHQAEKEFSAFNFEEANVADLIASFDNYERDALQLVDKGLILPGYDYCLKCSHSFNLLDARKAISVAERTRYIGRIRNIARKVAKRYLEQREEMGFPLLDTEKSTTVEKEMNA